MDFVRHKDVRTHLGYMKGAPKPDQHRKVLEKARLVHDPLASLISERVADQVEPESCRNSLKDNPSPISAATP